MLQQQPLIRRSRRLPRHSLQHVLFVFAAVATAASISACSLLLVVVEAATPTTATTTRKQQQHSTSCGGVAAASLQTGRSIAFVGSANQPRRVETTTTRANGEHHRNNPLRFLPAWIHENNVKPFAIKTSSSINSDRRRRSYLSSFFASADDEDEEEEEDEDEEETKRQRQRGRDRIRDWMYGSSGKGGSNEPPMVRPIRLDGQIDGGYTPQSSAQNPPRMRVKFDSLFAGMPSMDDILGATGNSDNDDDLDEDDSDEMSDQQGDVKSSKRKVDDSWFDEEKKQILANYEDVLKGMLDQLKVERDQDPESVPSSAEAMIKSILKQEMDTEIAETREKRMVEMLDAYEKETRLDADAMDVSGMKANASVQRLIDESEAEYAQKQADRLEIDDFLRYQQAAVLRATKEATQDESSFISRPAQGENLDQWALDRLKDMAGAREDSDGDEMILDILQENVDELESGMKMEARRTGSTQPESMKEWQMYRSIASRMEGDENEEGVDVTKESEIARDEQIMAQLESWKDYVTKEEGNRMISGLTRGPKLPFAWQESDLAARKAASFEPVATDKKSRIEARKSVNRRSLEAMESLLEKSDATRRDKLRKEIDYLRATLEASDYLDIDESTFEDSAVAGPVDTSDLFKSYSTSDEISETSIESSDRAWDSTPMTPLGATSYSYTTAWSSPVEASVSGEDDYGRPRTVPPPPPNTAFFAEVSEQGYDEGVTFTGDSRLGSMEEQKLEAMYRRAGARTTDERAAIRAQWEEFQEFEKGRRQQSGLSGESEEVGDSSANLKYNVSDVMRDDGDFDAAAILASIGPRPVRTKKNAKLVSGANNIPSLEDGEVGPSSLMSTVDKEEVMDSLYRAVSAVGGGRYKDDPVAKEQQRASFQELMEKENEMRALLDDTDTKELIDLVDDLPSPTDDVEYAEEVLSSLGPRPKPKRARIIDAGDYSDQGGALASEDDEDDEDEEEDDDDEPSASDESDVDLDLVPEWLRKENAESSKRAGVRKTFLGRDIDEVFDDSDYEHNMRQLAEYEKRRTGRTRQMGIDISDVLGRSALNSDDYADFKYDIDYFRSPSGGWGSGSFAARKANLLDYIELDVRELNALMDHKDSVYSTGVSQYLPRINKPFKEFGAIFRLEGVILDVNGLQLKAWTKVAEEYGFKKPIFEDVKQAAVTRPEVAIKDIFFWTDDFLECKNVAASHRKAFKDVFGAWAKDKGIDVPEAPVAGTFKGSLAMGEDAIQSKPQRTMTRPITEAERLEQVSKAWIATAQEYGKDAPGRDAILIAATLNPDIAITKALRWSSDPLEVDNIARAYRRNLRPDSEKLKIEADTSSVPTGFDRDDRFSKPRTQTDVMEFHYQAWLSVADSYGFEPPDADEVLAAFVINEPEIAARGFGWSEEPQMLDKVGKDFRAKLEELMNGGRSVATQSQSSLTPPVPSKPTDESPSSDEIFKVAFDAWCATAKSAGFGEPDNEQVLFALSVGPEEAIATGFCWTTNPYEVTKLVKSYRDELGRRRSSWQASGSAVSRPKQPVLSPPAEIRPSGPNQDEVYRAVFDSWTAIALELGFPKPDDEQVQFAMSVGPEEAIVNGFAWADDSTKIAELIEKYMKEIASRRSKWQNGPSSVSRSTQSGDDIPMFQVNPGVANWVKSLLDVEMQCGVVSYLDREQVDVLLKLAGIDHLIVSDKRVSATNGYITDKDQLLGAALRVERRPDHCVVFDSTPYSSVAAHDVEMQSVSLIGAFPRYELLSADTTAASFDALTAMNIRRLFSVRVYDQPLADVQQADPDKRRKTKTRFFYDDD